MGSIEDGGREPGSVTLLQEHKRHCEPFLILYPQELHSESTQSDQ